MAPHDLAASSLTGSGHGAYDTQYREIKSLIRGTPYLNREPQPAFRFRQTVASCLSVRHDVVRMAAQREVQP
jgi:hypothetical protein